MPGERKFDRFYRAATRFVQSFVWTSNRGKVELEAMSTEPYPTMCGILSLPTYMLDRETLSMASKLMRVDKTKL